MTSRLESAQAKFNGDLVLTASNGNVQVAALEVGRCAGLGLLRGNEGARMARKDATGERLESVEQSLISPRFLFGLNMLEWQAVSSQAPGPLKS